MVIPQQLQEQKKIMGNKTPVKVVNATFSPAVSTWNISLLNRET
jgi:hypothetical protein